MNEAFVRACLTDENPLPAGARLDVQAIGEDGFQATEILADGSTGRRWNGKQSGVEILIRDEPNLTLDQARVYDVVRRAWEAKIAAARAGGERSFPMEEEGDHPELFPNLLRQNVAGNVAPGMMPVANALQDWLSDQGYYLQYRARQLAGGAGWRRYLMAVPLEDRRRSFAE